MTRVDRLAAIPSGFYDRHPAEVAPDLLGCVLVHDAPGGFASGIIVETEAYATGDRASHAFRGPSRRNAAMFGPPGRAYVYRSHGIHWCMNAVCAAPGLGEAVLIRALEPIAGLDAMRLRRPGIPPDRLLCAGPGRLCQALAISAEHDGADLCAGILRIVGVPAAVSSVVAGPRVGITVDVERPWRFCIGESRYLSRRAG